MTIREWHLRFPHGPRGFPSMPVSNWFILKIFPFSVPKIALFSVFLGVSIAVISTMTKSNLGFHIRVSLRKVRAGLKHGRNWRRHHGRMQLAPLVHPGCSLTHHGTGLSSLLQFCRNNKLTLVSPARSWAPCKTSKSSFSCYCSSLGVYHRLLNCVLLHVSGNIINI